MNRDRCAILVGDAREHISTLRDCCVNTCVTSPPYWGLRDYGDEGQIGLESDPERYVFRLVLLFREVNRVLRDDGTLWLNLGDSYLHKSLVGIPWKVAFALQKDGWRLRSDIIWHKPNPIPEPVRDRPTKAHEYVFLFSKSDKYFYDVDALREPHESLDENGNHKWSKRPPSEMRTSPHKEEGRRYSGVDADPIKGALGLRSMGYRPLGRNRRSVWSIAVKPYKGAHCAVFPEELPRLCILAGAPVGGVVLDPFTGSGTTAVAALKLGRAFVGTELNPEYAKLAEERIEAA